MRDAGVARRVQLAGVEDPQERKVYIVQMREPSAAQFVAKMQRTTAAPAHAEIAAPALRQNQPARELLRRRARKKPGGAALRRCP